MMKLTPDQSRYSLRTIESIEPLTRDELEELRREGWRFIRQIPRTNKRGNPYWQSELERIDRTSAENRANHA